MIYSTEDFAMNVRKRSGTVVPFDPGFIQRAITLAAAAAEALLEEAE